MLGICLIMSLLICAWDGTVAFTRCTSIQISRSCCGISRPSAFEEINMIAAGSWRSLPTITASWIHCEVQRADSMPAGSNFLPVIRVIWTSDRPEYFQALEISGCGRKTSCELNGSLLLMAGDLKRELAGHHILVTKLTSEGHLSVTMSSFSSLSHCLNSNESTSGCFRRYCQSLSSAKFRKEESKTGIMSNRRPHLEAIILTATFSASKAAHQVNTLLYKPVP